MIVIEDYKVRSDGVKLIRTYSDAGFRLIRNDGIVYDEAVDVENSGYTYVESEDLIEEVIEDAIEEITEDSGQEEQRGDQDG